jgi:hypothetical protein
LEAFILTDCRKFKDAEQILAANLGTIMHLLKEKGVKEGGIVMSFLGKTSPFLFCQTYENVEL